MIDIGVARPSAQGHAMIRTDTATTSALGSRGSGPTIPQTMAARTAMPTTSGTNHDETWSASFWIGAREREASATIWTICASSVSRPTRSARIRKLPVWLTVAPVTLLPADFSTGIDSPVIIDSSTLEPPSTTTPSTGTLAPGRTRRRSPALICSSASSCSEPSASTRSAVGGAS
jgi:hypothetical protein